LAVKYLPLQENFLGGGLTNYLSKPWFWGFANFDGEHYLSIARQGYRELRYFFFPLYPLLIKFLASPFDKSLAVFVISGLLISHISFLFALLGLWKLVRMDFDKKVTNLTILLLFLFPTSFYFGSIYTESLFLALVVWSFYFARKGNFLLAGFLGGISTATRIVGLALIPALFFEIWLQKKKNPKKRINLTRAFVGVLLIPLGLCLYMWFLQRQTGDPLAFFHNLNVVFGEQRSAKLILLPQVFYRYFFKILPNLNFNYFPIVFTTFLELFSALFFLVLAVTSFWKLRLSYAVYFALGYLIPTLSGSFSSFPRYILVLFPGFIIFAFYFAKLPKALRLIFFALILISLGVATSLFTRGFWVS
jgi:Gpi18-like mannosyltransferase